jgi:glycosyltransferase involved in cell wall biosynthesis
MLSCYKRHRALDNLHGNSRESCQNTAQRKNDRLRQGIRLPIMEEKINISYILTTYNKFDYLKTTLPIFINCLLQNEELIITDGNSNDGTVSFIKDLIKDKSNISFISEEDEGESHGLNKALFLCRGEIIKNLTDDDAFNFYAVRKAACYMSEHEIDIMGFDGYGLSLHLDEYIFKKTNFRKDFDDYLIKKKPFFFCGLSYLIKRKSLPLLGLFSVNHKMVDLEYSFRISSGKCKIGWSNLLMFTNIYNDRSNTLIFNKALEAESTDLHKKYRSIFDFSKIYLRFKLQRILELKNKFLKKETFGKNNKLNFKEGFLKSIDLLEKENSTLEKINFYHK